jgi:trigger factor
VDEAVKRIISSNKSFKERGKTAKAREGDAVKIDFKGFVDGEAFEGGEAKEFQLELGSGQFIPGFEEQLVGSKAGDELNVEVTFPKEYHKEELAGKKAVFETKVHAVLQPEEAELNDEFAQTLGMESVEKLKEAIREQLSKEYDGLARNRMKKEMFDQLDEQASFDVPEGMFNLEFDSIWKQVEEARKQGDPSLADRDEAELKEEYKEIAARRVRLGIVLSQIAGRNDLEVGRDELTKAVMEQARMYPGQESKVIEFYQQHPEHLQELRGPILEEKAVDLIFSKVNVEEKKYSPEELRKELEEADRDKKKPAKNKKSSSKSTNSKSDGSKTKSDAKTATKKTDPAEGKAESKKSSSSSTSKKSAAKKKTA